MAALIIHPNISNLPESATQHQTLERKDAGRQADLDSPAVESGVVSSQPITTVALHSDGKELRSGDDADRRAK